MAQGSICANCGFMGQPKRVTKGSILIEIVLWLCFLLPGVLYSVWRLTTKHLACPKCKAENMVPLDTPRGKKLVQEFRQ